MRSWRKAEQSGRSRLQQDGVSSTTSPQALLRSTGLMACAFVICAAIGMGINPAAFSKFFFTPETLPALTGRSHSYYWDIALYGQLALKPACSAFYPLWAGIIRWVFHPQTLIEAGRGFLVMATGLFLGSLPVGVWLFQSALGRGVGFGIALAYVLSPMAIFRVNGYSEGLFGVLSLLLLGVLLPLERLAVAQPSGQLRMGWARGLALFGVTGLMALARPVMVQIVAAAIATLATLLLFAWWRAAPTPGKAFVQHCLTAYRQPLQATGLLSFSAVLGYTLYGEFCWRTRGSFFAPFQDQALWKKALGIHPELLLFPKSPFIDLLALYLPGLIVVVGFVWTYLIITGKNLAGFVPRSPRWLLLAAYPPALILSYGIQSLRLKFFPSPQTHLHKQEPTHSSTALIQRPATGAVPPPSLEANTPEANAPKTSTLAARLEMFSLENKLFILVFGVLCLGPFSDRLLYPRSLGQPRALCFRPALYLSGPRLSNAPSA